MITHPRLPLGVLLVLLVLLASASIVRPALAEQGSASLPSLEEQMAVDVAPTPQIGKPGPREGFCRFSCGLRCFDSTDCPGGASCDAFVTCSLERDAAIELQPLPTLEEQLRPTPASACGFFPACRSHSVCISFCGQFGWDGACIDGCCGCLA